MKILLVDDEPALCALYARQVAQLGHSAVLFTEGRSLCEAVRAGAHPDADLIWTDLAMPDIDGFEVIDVVREHRPSLPILVVSAHTQAAHLLQVMRGGVTNFIPKPVTIADLGDVLPRIEAVRRAERLREGVRTSLTRFQADLVVKADLAAAAASAGFVRESVASFLNEAEGRSFHVAVHELLLNAIEHGCLEITREEKIDALVRGRYPELLAERAATPRLAGNVARLSLRASREQGVEAVIIDPGPGFDVNALPDPEDLDNLFLPSGRGLMMARLNVDDLTFSSGGRVVTIRLRSEMIARRSIAPGRRSIAPGAALPGGAS